MAIPAHPACIWVPLNLLAWEVLSASASVQTDRVLCKVIQVLQGPNCPLDRLLSPFSMVKTEILWNLFDRDGINNGSEKGIEVAARKCLSSFHLAVQSPSLRVPLSSFSPLPQVKGCDITCMTHIYTLWNLRLERKCPGITMIYDL